MNGERGAEQTTACADDVRRAVRVLREGGVVAIPTDTVYGLAASLEHPAAIERLFSIKGRSGTKAIPVLVSDQNALDRLADEHNRVASLLAKSCWPGGLTIVVTANADIPDAVLRGGRTVGVRMPDHAIALAIIEQAGGALAVTSANRSGDTEATTSSEVGFKLGDRVDFIVDAGRTSGGVPSTVVDATRMPPVILREGTVRHNEILAALEGNPR
ncbi:MAG TPA: L-threonylcarbamoyladenylate synthase [Thermomicrobiales bacterium]|nr:L-threonylcarbamoyladenylate synthase [Thermomicrobiales bacterium]